MKKIDLIYFYFESPIFVYDEYKPFKTETFCKKAMVFIGFMYLLKVKQENEKVGFMYLLKVKQENEKV